MLTSELVELVGMIRRQKAEGQTIEVKAAEKGCPQKLYDTLSSFSNQDVGGTIVFGLDEKQDFALVGVYDLQELQKNVTEQCNQMEPPVRAVFTTAEIDGKNVCSAEIISTKEEKKRIVLFAAVVTKANAVMAAVNSLSKDL